MDQDIFKVSLAGFISKNFFWYAVVSLITGSFDPRTWWFTQFFWGGVLFTIFQLIILGSCLKKVEKNGN